MECCPKISILQSTENELPKTAPWQEEPRDSVDILEFFEMEEDNSEPDIAEIAHQPHQQPSSEVLEKVINP